MRNPSLLSDVLALIRAGNRPKAFSVKIGNTDITDHIESKGIKYTCYGNSNGDLSFGNTMKSQFEFDLINTDGSITLNSNTLYITFTIRKSGMDYDMNFEGYQIQKPDKTHDEIIHIIAYDKMRLFERPADAFFAQEAVGKTLAEYFQDLCSYCSVYAGTIPNHAVNTSKSFAQHPFNGEGYTCRDVLGLLAEAMGCNAYVRNSTCYLVWYTDYTSNYTILESETFERDLAEYTVPAVNKLQVKVTENDIGVVIGTGSNCYTIVNNPFLYGMSDADIRPYAQELYTKINAFGSYVPASVQCNSLWLIEPGDILKLQTGSSTYQNLPVMNMTWTYNGRTTAIFESTGEETRQEITYQNKAELRAGYKYHELVNTVDRFRSEILEKGYAKTIMQWTDPANDPDIELNEGDQWVRMDNGLTATWDALEDNNVTWDYLEENGYTWDDLEEQKVFAWDADEEEWVRIGGVSNVSYETLFEQSSRKILIQAKEYTDDNAYKKQSGIEIRPEGIQVTGERYVMIDSGGFFDVDSDNMSINSKKGYIRLSGLDPNNRLAQYFINSFPSITQFPDTDILVALCSTMYNSSPCFLLDFNVKKDSTYYYSGGLEMAYESVTHTLMEESTAQETLELFTQASLLKYSTMSGNPIRTSFGNSSSKIYYLYATKAYIQNIFGSTAKFASSVTALSFINSSSRDIKHDIQPLENMGDKIDKLKPVSYVYNDDPEEHKRFGLIFEDTKPVLPEICIEDEHNKAINYVDLVPVLLKEIQDLRARVAELEKKVNA